MGDSYTSGEGAPSFLPGTDQSKPKPDRCHRSYNSWGWQAALLITRGIGKNILFSACSTGTALSFRQPSGTFGEGAQTTQLQRFGHRADAVLVTMGGNDADFAFTIARCALLPDICPQDTAWVNNRFDLIDQAQHQITVSLEALVRSKNAPSPRHIYILGYPNPFIPVGDCSSLALLSPAEQAWIGVVWLGQLNAAVQAAAHAAGVTFVPDYSAFSGHGICAKNPYARGFVFPDVQQSFHPTKAGYTALAQIAEKRLRADKVIP
ncbi:MAG TPA: GDSL-type esterase/lipase family protein [Streptosporangiaceae bacterium]|nr:GDSL-type esterase/lipase family protein [Streptosporangiaceae bacterium]